MYRKGGSLSGLHFWRFWNKSVGNCESCKEKWLCGRVVHDRKDLVLELEGRVEEGRIEALGELPMLLPSCGAIGHEEGRVTPQKL